MKEKVRSQLQAVFYPRSVAVIGATDDPQRVGFNLLESVVYGGFRGKIYPVHPRLQSILGLPVYRSLDEIPGPVDLAVIALNQEATVAVLEDCRRRGVRGVVCVAGGFGEMGEEGAELEKRLAEMAAASDMLVIGPNTLGLINNDARLYATFYPLRLPAGRVSIVSQSGGVGLAVMQKALDEGMGVNKWIGVGNRTQLEFADYLEYLAADDGTDVIGVFLEGTDEARRFMQAAGRINLTKPVVVLKAGRSEEAGRFAVSHTGSMAGSYCLYRDICRQQGLPVVETIEELVAVCKALSLCSIPRGGRVGVLTHTAGPSIVAADRILLMGGELPAPAASTIAGIKEVIGQNPPVVLKNPLDVAGLGFAAGPYGRLAGVMLQDPGMDMLLAIYCLHKNWPFPTEELIRAKQKWGKPVIAYYVSTWEGCRQERPRLQEAGIPLYTGAEEAARAVGALVHYARLTGRRGAVGW